MPVVSDQLWVEGSETCTKMTIHVLNVSFNVAAPHLQCHIVQIPVSELLEAD